ncbi:MAG: DUF4352 domain-containing protein [Acutalibacteraceae bacterium]|nr:DUF4352 domain-containing protein [Acutalibacteraceae bacterium]
MKKVFLVLAACAVVSAALVGCGSSSSTEGTGSAATSTAAVSSSAESSTEEVSTVAIGETATIGGWEITVTSVEYAPELTPISQSSMAVPIPASDGNQFAIVNVQVKNISEDLESFLPSTSFVEHTEETLIYDGKYNYNGRSTEGLISTFNSLVDKVISPLETKTGYIAFDVPNEVAESEKPLQLKIEQKKDYKTLDSVLFSLR